LGWFRKTLEELVLPAPADIHTDKSTSMTVKRRKEYNSPKRRRFLNPLNAELNPICYLLALLAQNFLHVSRIRVKSLTLRLLMSYIYIYIYI
jgi:hypothetical protein